MATPDRFWNRSLGSALVDAKRVVATEVARCEPEHLVLVDNLTVASTMLAESVLQDCLNEGTSGVVLLTSFTYNAVKLAFEAAAERAAAAGVELRIEVAPLAFPIRSTEELVLAFQGHVESLDLSGMTGREATVAELVGSCTQGQNGRLAPL